MNVLLCTRTFASQPSGGVANSLNYLGQTLLSDGHKVILLAERQEGEQEREDVNGIIVIRHERFGSRYFFRENPFYLSRLKRTLQQVIQHYEVNSVISRHLYYSFCVRYQIEECVYLLASFYGPETREFMNRSENSLLKRAYLYIQSLAQDEIEKRLFRELDQLKVATLSERRRNELVLKYGIAPGLIQVIPPGVDQEVFSPREHDLIRKRVGLDESLVRGRCIFVCVCRHEWRKNLDELIDIFARSSYLRQNASLILIGTGPQTAHLERRITSVRADHIYLAGFQENTNEWYNCGDVFVFPSLQEGFGQVFLEAMSSGLPVVAYGRGRGVDMPTDEIVQDGETGLIVDRDDPDAFEAALVEIAANPNLRKNMSKAARRRTETSYHWSTTAKNLLALLEIGD